MTAGRDSLCAFWDRKAARDAQTGFEDRLLYRYDQPLRLRRLRRVVAELYPGGFAGRTALDVGCGTGDFARLWAEQGARRVYAMDISPAVVDIARKRLVAFPQIEIRAGALQDAPPFGEGIDAATSVTVLQHIVDDGEAEAAVRGIAAALKADGYFIALEISPPAQVTASMPGLLKERTVGEWLGLFARAGLAQVRPPAVYSPLGFTAVQLWIPRGLRRALGPVLKRMRAPAAAGGGTEAADRERRGLVGRIARLAYAGVRAVVLAATYPVDRVWDVRLPESQAYYHVFIMKRPG